MNHRLLAINSLNKLFIFFYQGSSYSYHIGVICTWKKFPSEWAFILLLNEFVMSASPIYILLISIHPPLEYKNTSVAQRHLHPSQIIGGCWVCSAQLFQYFKQSESSDCSWNLDESIQFFPRVFFFLTFPTKKKRETFSSRMNNSNECFFFKQNLHQKKKGSRRGAYTHTHTWGYIFIIWWWWSLVNVILHLHHLTHSSLRALQSTDRFPLSSLFLFLSSRGAILALEKKKKKKKKTREDRWSLAGDACWRLPRAAEQQEGNQHSTLGSFFLFSFLFPSIIKRRQQQEEGTGANTSYFDWCLCRHGPTTLSSR